MLDVLDLIVERGGNPEAVRESQRRRFAPVEVVDQVIDLWQDHRRTLYAATQLNAKINEIQKQIGAKKKAKENADELLQQKIAIEKEKKEILDSAAAKEKIMNKALATIGNIIHDSVPVSATEDDNPTLRTWVPADREVPIGQEDRSTLLSHHELLLRIDGYNPEAGVKVVGHRGYFLKNWGVFLNQAIINFGLEFLTQQHGYTALQSPFMMSKEVMAQTAQLDDFDEQLYKACRLLVVDGDSEKYLIASEQPISAYHAGQWLQPAEMPIKYAGFSTCFRREAGSHGKDAWGTFRVHQFEKVEQFVLCDPEKSWEMFDAMIANSEEFCQALGLPYRVIAIVSGAFNQAASKKFDLEAWFPYQAEYKELVSCSNCTDFQSRALDIRYGAKTQTDAKKKYVHCLNSTLTATSRTMCAILENFQTPEGVRIPEPLRKYLPGAPDFLPFTKELPKDSTSQKAKAKSDKGGAKQKVAAAAGAASDAVNKAADKLKDVTV
ncbi:seryl-tRNA synthetase [Grosmannia clavigera kw1407]|uniref:serine--tRNA ligase n=1 Tax=Grosmannia clavigera (strain kw1407 / UAMH 11150) TaxID=655863 RepID=F0XM27_GROCL|nr:seryl-tRNA synthetase [Grosmannia clavigera kw1407]EFX01289.1 seryl-tRNA synthetase [Grosmannia clavigera kw1407]